MKLFLGLFFALIGQVVSFLVLQGSVKYDWDQKHLWILLLSSIPTTWIYIKSVSYLVSAFDGQIWPSRLLGFGVGMIVFTSLSIILFKEPINYKTLVSVLLALCIILIQIFWK